MANEQNNNQMPPVYPYPYPPYPPVPPDYYKPKKSRSFWKGLLKFLAITSGIIFVLVMLLFFVVKPIADNWLKSIGSSGIFQMLDLYKEVSADVNESEVVNDPFLFTDFTSAKQKIVNKGLDIFADDENKIDINKISADLYFNDIFLNSNEAASILNSALDDAVKKLDNPTINSLNINFDLKQLSLKKTNVAGVYDFTIIAYANLNELGNQMGVLGVIMPEKVYLNLNSKAKIDTDGKMIFTENNIKVNKISEKSLNELFNIINKVLFPDRILGDKTIVQETADFLAGFLHDGFNLMENTLKMRVVPALDSQQNAVFKWSSLNNPPIENLP